MRCPAEKAETMEEAAIAAKRTGARARRRRRSSAGLIEGRRNVLDAALRTFLEEDAERWALAREVYRSNAFVASSEDACQPPRGAPRS